MKLKLSFPAGTFFRGRFRQRKRREKEGNGEKRREKVEKGRHLEVEEER